MCREIVENVLSGTKVVLKATRNLVFNQKAERSTMNRQKSREIFDNMPSATKAVFKSIFNFEHAIEREKKMENQKSNSTFSVILLTLILMVAAIWVSPAAIAAEKEMVRDPATGEMVTAPEYGGTLTWAAASHAPNTDPWHVGGWAPHFISGVNEVLAFTDWATSRDIFNFAFWDRPHETTRGNLAESWSMPDDTTMILNIRQGVHFALDPDSEASRLVGGRELDASDVEWNYHRMLGLGDFTADEPPAQSGGASGGIEIESVTATDKWTVAIKLTKPQLSAEYKTLNNWAMLVLPREVVEKYGDYRDWRNVVGTGPLMLTEYVEGVSITWEKNPDYWGYDEKFPQNRLPYIDEYRSLLMKEPAARVAALRTGKIDMMGNAGDANIASIDNLLTIQRTNPEIDVWPVYGMGTAQFVFNLALPPTSDLNVRKALNMAVDRETVSATFHKGWGDPEPIGLMLPVEGWSWPYDEWPEDVKQEYTYNPERAEELLDAAGYKRGADGYRFKIMLAHYDRWDTSYSELVGGYLDAIGVDSELVVQTYPEHAAEQSLVTSRFAAITTNHGYASGTLLPLRRQIQKVEGWSYTKVNDPRLLALYEGGKDSLDIEEIKSISRQTDEIFVKEHFALAKARIPQFSLSQPWVIGYSGEWNMGRNQRNTLFARLWIDSELKAAMGH